MGNPADLLGTLVTPVMGDGLLDAAVDKLFELRYGVGRNEKERQAMQGEIPGHGRATTPDEMDREERRASSYLFAKKWPRLSEYVQPAVNALRATPYTPFSDDYLDLNPEKVKDLAGIAREASHAGSLAGRGQNPQAALIRRGVDSAAAIRDFMRGRQGG